MLAIFLYNPFSRFSSEYQKIYVINFCIDLLLIIYLLKTKKLEVVRDMILDWCLDIKLWSIEFLLFLYGSVYVIATIFSTSLGISFWGNGERGLGLWTVAHGILFYFLVKYFLTKKTYLRFLEYVCWFSVPVFFLALYQQLNPSFFWLPAMPLYGQIGKFRSFATLAHPNFLGIFSVIIIIIASSFAHNSKKTKIKILYLAIIAMNLITLGFTHSRASWLALISSIGYVAMVSLSRTKHKKKIFFLIITATILIFTTLFSVPVVRNRLKTSLGKGSIYARTEDYKYAISRFEDMPILGYGPESFYSLSIQRNMSEYEKSVDPRPADKVHNLFLDTIINTGFIGLLIYIALLVKITSLVVAGIKKENKEIALFGAVIVAYFVWMNLNFDYSFSLIIFYYILSGIDMFSVETREEISEPRSKLSCGILITILIILAISLYQNIWVLIV